MVQLKKYQDFLDRVDELGFMALSNILPGFPSVSKETPKEIWHTGDADSDPWCWKDRAAEEKKLAFGCVLGGHKGFVSARMYPTFYVAFHPEETMEERREAGIVNQMTWQLWKLFEVKTLLDTGNIRQEMGVSLKKGGSSLDTAIKELQRYFYITVAGNRRKIDKLGKPYGWPANTYDKVMNWVPKEWMQGHADICREEAREEILKIGTVIGNNIEYKKLVKILCI